MKKRYFQFPLFLLRNLLIDKQKCLNDIVFYGIYSFSNSTKQKGKSVLDFFRISGDFKSAYERGKEIAEMVPEKEPMPMMDKNKLFEYRDEDKSEFELLKYAVTIGMRSILGKKSYCKTTKEMIFCRAFGYKNIDAMGKKKPDLFVKYFNRYQTDKILNDIEIENWNLFRYSSQNMRGLYIAKKRSISLEKLIETVEEKNKKRKIETLKDKKKLIREQVISKLKQQQRNNNETTT